MQLLSRGIMVFAVLIPLTLTGQVASLHAYEGGRIQRRKAALVPPPVPQAVAAPAIPDVVEALPMPLAPLTPAEMPAQPPRVTYSKGVLTVDAQNSTLSDILKAISKSTGAEFDPMPEAAERTVVHLSGSADEVVSGLLRGSAYGYVLISSQEDSAVLQKVLLIPPEPAKGAKPTSVRAMVSRPIPSPASTEPAEEPISSAPVPDVTAPPATVSTAPSNSASLTEDPTISFPRQQGGVTVPDPAQFIEHANQQNQQNPGQSQMSGAGQYMQELYKLRLQQQPGQASSAQPSSATQQ
jgi:hypothetical protein